jgi:hypothetical protein
MPLFSNQHRRHYYNLIYKPHSLTPLHLPISPAPQPFSSIIIWQRIPKSTPSVPLLRYNGARTLPGFEAAAGRRAVCVRGAYTGDELFSRCWCRGVVVAIVTVVAVVTVVTVVAVVRIAVDGVATAGGVIRCGVSETAAAVALLCYDRCGAFAGVEAAAGGGAVGVGGAGAGDELGALSLGKAHCG